MDVELIEDPGEFAARAQPVFEAEPIHTNVIGTWLQDALAGRQTIHTRWFIVVDDAEPLGVAMHTEGRSVVISPLPEGISFPVAQRLTELLTPHARLMTGATGRQQETGPFAAAWRHAHGGTWQVIMKDWIHTIDHPPAGPDVPGTGRLSEPRDTDVLVAQLSAFHREAFHGTPSEVAGAEAAERVRRRPLHVWEADGVIVSVAGVSGPVSGIGRVGPVYTPPQHRRRGFGAAVSAFATRTAFERGARQCMLYADQDNPTSNAVYARLGYRRVDDNQMLAYSPS